jgi:hypothetical protein
MRDAGVRHCLGVCRIRANSGGGGVLARVWHSQDGHREGSVRDPDPIPGTTVGRGQMTKVLAPRPPTAEGDQSPPLGSLPSRPTKVHSGATGVDRVRGRAWRLRPATSIDVVAAAAPVTEDQAPSPRPGRPGSETKVRPRRAMAAAATKVSPRSAEDKSPLDQGKCAPALVPRAPVGLAGRPILTSLTWGNAPTRDALPGNPPGRRCLD